MEAGTFSAAARLIRMCPVSHHAELGRNAKDTSTTITTARCTAGFHQYITGFSGTGTDRIL
jgi:hypothetical protein